MVYHDTKLPNTPLAHLICFIYVFHFYSSDKRLLWSTRERSVKRLPMVYHDGYHDTKNAVYHETYQDRI